MKTLKKMMALMIAVVMCMATTLTVFATGDQPASTSKTYPKTSDGNFSITINANADDKGTHTYDAYQIFAGDLTQTEGASGEYNNIDGTTGTSTATGKTLSNVTWGSAIADATALQTALLASDLKAEGHVFAGLTAASTASDYADALAATGVTADDVQLFADIVSEYATVKANETTPSITGNQTATIEVKRPGYYLIKETVTSNTEATKPAAYSDFILQILDNVTITAKSSVPAVEKKVKEGDYTTNDKSEIDTGVDLGTGFNDVADYSIGDIIDYEILGTVADNYAEYNVYSYKFIDTIECDGLEFVSVADQSAANKVVVQYTNDDGATWKSFPTDKYIVTIAGKELTVEFPVEGNATDGYSKKGLKEIQDVTKDTVIRVSYQAKLNKDAVIGLPGNPNKVKLEFSNNPNKGGEGDKGETPEDKVIVFTYELDSTKYHDSVSDSNKLAGASFILKNKDDKVLLASSFTGDDLTAATWGTIAAPTTDADKADPVAYYVGLGAKVFTTTADGKITKIEGLTDEKYTLVEIKAPGGYNLAGDTEVTVTATTVNGQAWDSFAAKDALITFEYSVKTGSADATITTQDGTAEKPIDGIAKANIIDRSGNTLPSTGGIGTTIFYVLGAILVVGAGVVLVTRRRMSAN